MAYCDEPAIVLAEIVNESDLFLFKVDTNVVEPYKSEFITLFDEWLSKNGISKKACEYTSFDTEDEDLVAFKMHLQTEYYKEMYNYMRNIGIKIPITGTNYRPFPAVVKSQRVTDYTDAHPYIGGFQNWKEFEHHCVSNSITGQKLSLLDYVAVATQEDMPVYISEWDQQWPNEYRAESPYFGLGVQQSRHTPEGPGRQADSYRDHPGHHNMDLGKAVFFSILSPPEPIYRQR